MITEKETGTLTVAHQGNGETRRANTVQTANAHRQIKREGNRQKQGRKYTHRGVRKHSDNESIDSKCTSREV